MNMLRTVVSQNRIIIWSLWRCSMIVINSNTKKMMKKWRQVVTVNNKRGGWFCFSRFHGNGKWSIQTNWHGSISTKEEWRATFPPLSFSCSSDHGLAGDFFKEHGRAASRKNMPYTDPLWARIHFRRKSIFEHDTTTTTQGTLCVLGVES